MTSLLIGLVALLAFANGSNDNGKGVATLVGFGAARPLTALTFATIATALGGVFSFFLAGAMLKGFTGNWLFAPGIILDQHFYIAVLIGACGWVLLATRTGMPISTTHAIVGALTGAGLISFGNTRFQWALLGQKFAVPLAVSPVLSLAIVYIVAWPVLIVITRLAGRCICIVDQTLAPEAVTASAAQCAASDGGQLAIVVGGEADCSERAPIAVASTSTVATAIHWMSGGMISFARGWNDTPKIAALGLLALSGVNATAVAFVIVICAMAVGGLIMGRKVLDTLARKVTPLPMAESLTASLVTACLVGLASWVALPVSTTHVATGSIIGAGLRSNPARVKWTKVGEIVLSWMITLPVAASIAMAAKFLIR